MHLPWGCVALWFAPLFTHSRTVSAAPIHQIGGSEPTSQAFAGADISQSHAAFHLPCQADDEAFDFSFKVLEPFNGAACGSSNLLLNGQQLNQDWSNRQWLFADHGRSNLTIPSAINHLNRTLEVSSKSVCLASALAGAGNSPLPAKEGDAVQITFVRIERIDGRPSLSHAGFTVSFDQLKQQIIGVVDSVADVAHSVNQANSSLRESESDNSSPTDEPSLTEDSSSLALDDEASKLQYLQNELDALTLAVHRQQLIVEDLSRTNDSESVIELKQCHDLKCVAKSILQRAQHCVHIIVVKLTPGNSRQPSEPTIDPDCYWTHSRQARMSAAMKGEKLCSKEHATPQPQRGTSATKFQSSNRPSSFSTSSFSSSGRSDTVHSLLVPAGVIASFFCLSCLFCQLHRRCCNPRARAERAARCEERRTRRQYARLARRHKWRTWWNQRLGRNNKPSSTDYEEKRSLILAQERVLEDAMQVEIQRIRHSHGFSDEEAGPDTAESLPPYRSRAGSGRPPSYTSEPVDTEGSTTVVVSLVNDVTSGLHDRPPRSPVSDMTPDSSIANLSRRNSSDTLHSELSII